MANVDEPTREAGFTACPCPVMPHNWWRSRNGEWHDQGPIADDGNEATAALRGEATAAAYIAGGFTRWYIRCPTCGHIYGAGD